LIKKVNSPRTETNRRRRRKPEAAEAEILSAAESFLREHPFRDMTVDNVMARTGLSRPSFYEYFRDRSDLIVKLVDRLYERDRALSAMWFTDSDSAEGIRHTVRELVQSYVSHGPLLRALSDSTHVYENVEERYREGFRTTVGDIARRIREFVANGEMSIEGLDPPEIAAALVGMNERYLIEKFGRDSKADPRVVTDTLVAIWLRVLHGIPR
jgi:AcrR family transcriptional regulator